MMIVEFSKREPAPAFKDRVKARYYYRVKSCNGQVMLLSRPYDSYLKCVMGWRTVQKNLGFRDAKIKYRWAKGF